MSKMRAIAVIDYTSPLQLVELPKPTAPPGFVLIHVLTCGVCYTDVKICQGHMPFSASLKLPHIPGHEICGEVVETGPETGFQIGERVVVYNYWSCGRCSYCQAGLEQLCESLKGWVGFISPGGFAEFLAVPADRLLRVPEGVTPEQASIAACAIGTSYRAVITKGRVHPGDTVVVLGAGGVGLHALQVAQVAGARVLAVDVDPRKLEVAAWLGIVGVALAGEEAETLVREQTRGLKADVVICTVSHPDGLHQATRLTRRGGRVIGAGYMVGSFVQILADEFVLHEIEFIGSRYMQRHELERSLTLMATGQVTSIIDEVLPLEAANEALGRLIQGHVIGRMVLRIRDAGRYPQLADNRAEGR